MASVVNQCAIQSYAADMQMQLADLLEDAGHPLAERARALAHDLKPKTCEQEDRPPA